MTKPVRPESEAEEEFRAEIRWYEGKTAGLGQQLWDEIQHAIVLISQHPAIGSVVPNVKTRPTPRRIRLRRFPFYLVYREREQEIQIIALAPTSKKPGYWKSRSV